MKYTRIYLFWFVAISISIILTACYKDPSKVGFGIQPPSDRIELYGDDSTVLFLSYTVEHDSVSTANLPTLVLGSVNDPVFGSTQAAFNTQFRLSQIKPNLGKDISFDSICLQLGYSGRWGDSTTWMTAHVYRLTDSLFFNSDTTGGKTVRENYYATDVIGYDPNPLGTKEFLDQPFDSVELKRSWWKRLAGMHAPFLSIKLDKKYGEEILSYISDTSTNSDDFVRKFPGLHVAVDSVSGSFGKMLYFNVTSPETKLVVYYNYLHTATNTRRDSSYAFVIDEKNATRFNEYRVNHSVAQQDLQNQLSDASPQSGDQRLYLQPLNGVRIKVNFSGIEELRKRKNTVINEAKLYLNSAEPYDKDLPPVQYITTYTINANGKVVLTPDSELGLSYMGGKFDKEKNRYVMRITRYLQKRILDPSMDNDNLYISISGASYNANRVVLYGNNPNDDNDKKVKIRILYSEY